MWGLAPGLRSLGQAFNLSEPPFPLGAVGAVTLQGWYEGRLHGARLSKVPGTQQVSSAHHLLFLEFFLHQMVSSSSDSCSPGRHGLELMSLLNLWPLG